MRASFQCWLGRSFALPKCTKPACAKYIYPSILWKQAPTPDRCPAQNHLDRIGQPSFNLRLKANPVPLPAASFKCLYPKGRNGLRREYGSERFRCTFGCLHPKGRNGLRRGYRLCRPFGYRLLPFTHPTPVQYR